MLWLAVVWKKEQLFNMDEATDLSAWIPEDAIHRLHLTRVANSTRKNDGTLNPTDDDIRLFASFVKPLLKHYLPEKYKQESA